MSSSLGSIELPVDLQWIDEYAWSPVAQQNEIALNGALIIEESKQLAGRPITLQGRLDGAKGFGAIQREVLEDLRLLASDPLTASIVLSLDDGRTFNVRFRYTDGVPVEATPLKHIVPALAADYYFPTIRLIQV